MMQRIGILGGSFNPIHWGHLILAEEARQILNLQKIIFIPANIPPLKDTRNLAPAKNRYQMVKLAIKPNPHFQVSTLELERGGLSYSIDTCKELKARYTGSRLYLIVGSDFLKEYQSWRNIDRLKNICQIVIAARPGYPLRKIAQGMQAIKISDLDISSSEIRKRLQNNLSIRYLVPETVRKYILKNKLYRVRIKKI